MPELILHHYPMSPYAEKARVALGVKRLTWRSVTIPVVMPKPDLTALTGGYRKTPVLQVGSDIYCDTALILRELERRHPAPTFYPAGSQGTADALATWADKQMFPVAVGIVLTLLGDNLPEGFREDRAKFSGRDFNPERMKAALPYLLDQLRGLLQIIDGMLARGPYLLGAAPSLADLAAYHPLWFIPSRLGNTIPPLSDYPRVLAWMEKIKAFGHGTPSDMTGAEAIAIAQQGKPATKATPDSGDPNARKPGTHVSVCPDDTGRDPVVGELVSSSVDEIVIARSDKRAGNVHVHFPKLGFAVRAAA